MYFHQSIYVVHLSGLKRYCCIETSKMNFSLVWKGMWWWWWWSIVSSLLVRTQTNNYSVGRHFCSWKWQLTIVCAELYRARYTVMEQIRDYCCVSQYSTVLRKNVDELGWTAIFPLRHRWKEQQRRHWMHHRYSTTFNWHILSYYKVLVFSKYCQNNNKRLYAIWLVHVIILVITHVLRPLYKTHFLTRIL